MFGRGAGPEVIESDIQTVCAGVALPADGDAGFKGDPSVAARRQDIVAPRGRLVFEKLMGWHGPNIDQHMTMTNIFAVVAIAVYVFALRAKKKDLNGVMSWKQGFISGAIITGVVVLFSPLSQWITHTFISPEYFPNIIEHSVSTGQVDRETAEGYFNLWNYTMQSIIGALVMGLITSAVVAFFVKSKPAEGGQEPPPSA